MRLIAFAAALMLAATTAASAPKPKIPAGLDPGGVTVALVGNGIDYTRPTISHRLARNGEGERHRDEHHHHGRGDDASAVEGRLGRHTAPFV